MWRALLLVLFALPAAASPKVAVAEVAAPPDLVGLGAQVTEELVALARAQRMSVVPPDEVRRRVGEKLYAELNDCADDARCLAERVAALGPLRLVSGTLARTESAYLLDLWLFDGGTRAFVATARLSVLIGSRRLLTELRAATPRLLRGERQASGTLSISADVEGASAQVDGAPPRPLPVELELSAGKHLLRVERPDYLPVERYVLIEPGRRVEQRLRLHPVPRRIDLRPGEPRTETEVTRSRGLRVPGFALAALGVGALSLGGGVVAGMAAGRTEADPELARRYQLGSIGMYALGGALVGAGAVATAYQTLHVEPGVRIALGGRW